MIPTTFEIPAGYFQLALGAEKQPGDLFLNRVCNPNVGEWAWCEVPISGTEWARCVEEGKVIIRRQSDAAPIAPIPEGVEKLVDAFGSACNILTLSSFGAQPKKTTMANAEAIWHSARAALLAEFSRLKGGAPELRDAAQAVCDAATLGDCKSELSQRLNTTISKVPANLIDALEEALAAKAAQPLGIDAVRVVEQILIDEFAVSPREEFAAIAQHIVKAVRATPEAPNPKGEGERPVKLRAGVGGRASIGFEIFFERDGERLLEMDCDSREIAEEIAYRINAFNPEEGK